MRLDLQSLFGLMGTAVFIGYDPKTPPPRPLPLPHLGSYTIQFNSHNLLPINISSLHSDYNPIIFKLFSYIIHYYSIYRYHDTSTIIKDRDEKT
jgi:hypothetical protein